MRVILLMFVALSLPVGCARPTGKGLADDDAAFKIPAIKAAAVKQDRSAVPQLVADLGNSDPAIRFYAIEALQRMTGHDFGYRYFDDESDRAPAVVRWQEWLARQEP